MYTPTLNPNPHNGARYCVRQPDADAPDGWQYATNIRGGLWTVDSRQGAMRHADFLNSKNGGSVDA